MAAIGGGRYILGHILGEGTFGQVLLGSEACTGEAVAIKVLEKARATDAGARARLHNEVEILRRVEHGSLLRLLEVVEEPEATYLVTEHVGGGELFAHISRSGHLPEAEAAALFAQMLSAVHCLHGLGIVHRDLKPENMLLSGSARLDRRPGAEGAGQRELKIIDFGLGAILPSADEVLTTACGSPHYAAPEMLLGDGYTGRRADLWSLGVCLFAALCGCLPFDEDDMERLYDQIIAGRFSFDGCPELSAGAVSMLRGLLTTDPERRLSAPEALSHEWLASHQLGRPTALAGSAADLARAKVLRALSAEFAVPRERVARALASRERTYETSLYFLVRQREVQRGSVLDQPRYWPTPPPPRLAAQGRRPVRRRLREAGTVFAAHAGAPRSPLPRRGQAALASSAVEGAVRAPADEGSAGAAQASDRSPPRPASSALGEGLASCAVGGLVDSAAQLAQLGLSAAEGARAECAGEASPEAAADAAADAEALAALRPGARAGSCAAAGVGSRRSSSSAPAPAALHRARDMGNAENHVDATASTHAFEVLAAGKPSIASSVMRKLWSMK